ncbi:MAG: beta-galactosidase [Bryobacteraceae bacterium]
MNRRNMIQLGMAGLALQSRLSGDAIPSSSIGRITPRPGTSITASPLSLGFETLDRNMFDPKRAYPHVAKLGVKWARLQTGWARTERTKGVYDFGWLDEVVDSLLKIGVQPWFNLGYGNTLYTPGAPHMTAVGYVPFNSPEARAAWVAYTGRIADHFRGRVRHYEIWNEPNGKGFWRPYDPDPVGYAELVKITAPEIRKRVPKAVIIGIGLAGLGNQIDYVKRALDAGLANYIDKLSYHPYRAIPESNYSSEVRALRALLSFYKAGIGLWQGENGAASVKGGTGNLDLDGTEAAQAKWTVRRVVIDLQAGVELTSVFHTVDLVNYIWSGGPSGKTQNMGLLREDYTPKPAYYAYQTLCALLDSESRQADDLLAMVNPSSKAGAELDVQSATFIRKGAPLVAFWRAADLRAPYVPSRVAVHVWLGKKAQMTTPVLIDPLSGKVHKPEQAEQKGGYWRFPDLPLLDYPIFIADASIAV